MYFTVHSVSMLKNNGGDHLQVLFFPRISRYSGQNVQSKLTWHGPQGPLQINSNWQTGSPPNLLQLAQTFLALTGSFSQVPLESHMATWALVLYHLAAAPVTVRGISNCMESPNAPDMLHLTALCLLYTELMEVPRKTEKFRYTFVSTKLCSCYGKIRSHHWEPTYYSSCSC